MYSRCYPLAEDCQVEPLQRKLAEKDGERADAAERLHDLKQVLQSQQVLSDGVLQA